MAVNEFQNMPQWVTDGLNHSSVLNDMKDSLRILAERKSTGSKEHKETEKVAKEFNRLSVSGKKLASSLSEASAGTKKNTKEVDYYHKTLAQHTKNLSQSLSSGGLGGVITGVGNSLSKLGDNFGILGKGLFGSLGMIGTAVGELYKVLETNSNEFYKLAEFGVNVGSSFEGMMGAAAAAGVGIDEYSRTLQQNSDIIALTNDIGTKRMGRFIAGLKFGEKSVFDLGYTMDQALDEMTVYSHILKSQGRVTSQSEEGFKDFIEELSGVSTALGVSGKVISDLMLKAAQDPTWQAFTATMGKNGSAMSEAFNQFTMNISGLISPETASRFNKLMQEMVQTGGAPVSAESTAFFNEIASATPQLRNYLTEVSRNIALGKKTQNIQIGLIDGMKKLDSQYAASALLHPELHQGLGLLVNDFTAINQLDETTLKQKQREMEDGAKRNKSMQEFKAMIDKLSSSLMMAILNVVDRNGGFGALTSMLNDYVTPAVEYFANFIRDFADPKKREKMWDNLTKSLGIMFGKAIGIALKQLFVSVNPFGLGHLVTAIDKLSGAFEDQTEMLTNDSESNGLSSGGLSVDSTGKMTYVVPSDNGFTVNKPQTSGKTPLGIRNNNPGNLRSWGGIPSVGGFAQFPTLEAGIRAEKRQLGLYGERGINTLSGIASKWAPSNENDTSAYISNLSKRTGFNPTQLLDMKNPDTINKIANAINANENGSSYGNMIANTDSQNNYMVQMIQQQTALNNKIDAFLTISEASHNQLVNISKNTKDASPNV